jgi:hypothetical protein
MTAIPAEQRTSTPPIHLPQDGAASFDPHRAASAIRADRTDARWTVRVVLETDAATSAARSVRAIVFDRDTGASVLHTVWSDWREIPLLAAHVPATSLPGTAARAVAANLAESLLGLLGSDPTACLAALRVGDTPTRLPGMSRRDRQYRHIVRDAAWHDPGASREPDGGALYGRADMSAAETAQRQQTGWLSGQADRARGDS